MNCDNLLTRLERDLAIINLPIDEVDLFIRPFSKTYYGRYFPLVKDEGKAKIFLYPFSDEGGNTYSYSELLETVIHEMIHHLQYTNESFVRYKGVMHDTNFWRLYNLYVSRAQKYNLMGGVENAKKYAVQ